MSQGSPPAACPGRSRVPCREECRSSPSRSRLDSTCRRIRWRERPRSAPSVIGLNVFVSTVIASRTSEPFVASHSPIHVSLLPPPYASAVSNVRIPSSQAASMIRGASSCGIPWPKKAGEEPTPPKLPQPRTIRVTDTPLRPSSRVSTRAILGRTRAVRAELGRRERRRDLDCAAFGDGRRGRVEDLDDVRGLGARRPVRPAGDDRARSGRRAHAPSRCPGRRSPPGPVGMARRTVRARPSRRTPASPREGSSPCRRGARSRCWSRCET